jgi:HEAT repeat protein
MGPFNRAINDEDMYVRSNAAIVMFRMVDQLTKALKEKNNDLRLGSVSTLGTIKDVRSLAPLAEAMRDENQDIRREAAMAIGGIGDARGVSPLLEALKDPDGAVRREAAWGLVRIGERAVDPLLGAFDDGPAYRWELVWALGEIKDERSVGILIRALKDPDEEVRREAAWALWFIGDDRATMPLREALGQDPALYEAEIALSNIEQKDTLDRLRYDLLARIEKEKAEKEAFESIKPQMK